MPVMSVSIKGVRYDRALIDTGFSGFLAVDFDIGSQLDLRTSGPEKFARSAGGGAPYRDAFVDIEWFGQIRNVHVVVWQEVRTDLAKLVIGVGVLIGYVLLVDFNEGVVTVIDPSLAAINR